MTTSLKALRCIQVYIGVLNAVNDNLIFTWKLLSIGVCILTGYAGIAHFGDYPIFGAMYCVTFVNCSEFYMVLFTGLPGSSSV